MFGRDELKPLLEADGDFMPCPVKGCEQRVKRQTRAFRRAPEFRCPVHHIYIGPSTFEYEEEEDNLLWRSDADADLMGQLVPFKRESRMARERSEDALTWNVFRHLETSGRLARWATAVAGTPVDGPVAHYWSYDAASRTVWAPLAAARLAFSEAAKRESEPDLILEGRDVDVWIEAKLGSSNDTAPTNSEDARKRYTEGGHGWFAKVVTSPFDVTAIEKKRYELLRLWLLGSWTAQQRGKRFVLLNLVREGFEEDVEDFARTHFVQSPPDRCFRRVTWESILSAVDARTDRTINDARLVAYMRGKTLGYQNGRLMRAFAVQ